MKRPVLEVEDISLSFGGVQALSNVSMTVMEDEVFALVGPNGAGKTSLLNCINGFYRPNQGSIRLLGEELRGRRPHQIAALGVGRTFQNIELFGGISVLDNVLMGREIHWKHGFLANSLFVGPAAREEAAQRQRVEEIMELLELGSYRNELVGSLPYGKQKLVEMARALALEPKLLLLDEPAAGMNRGEKEDVARFIVRVRHLVGVAQIIIEHDIGFVSDLSDRVTVLNLGRTIAEGVPAEVFSHPEVMAAYTGASRQAETLAHDVVAALGHDE